MQRPCLLPPGSTHAFAQRPITRQYRAVPTPRQYPVEPVATSLSKAFRCIIATLERAVYASPSTAGPVKQSRHYKTRPGGNAPFHRYIQAARATRLSLRSPATVPAGLSACMCIVHVHCACALSTEQGSGSPVITM